MNIAATAKDIFVILSALGLITSILYWALSSKLKDDFCTKADCEKRHNNLDSWVKDDISELKQIVTRIENRLYAFIDKFVDK
jgi:hypothetical protein